MTMTTLTLREVRFGRGVANTRLRSAFAPGAAGRNRLVRTFVPTGNARCPLACVWSVAPETSAALDDAGLSWPAMGAALLRRALYCALTFAC